MKKIKVIFLILIVTTVIGIVAMKVDNNSEYVKSSSLDLGIPIQLEKVELGNLQESIHYDGIMGPKSTVSVSSKITAEVQAIYAEEGDFVEAGTVIGKIDDSQFIANRETVENKLRTAQVNYNYLCEEVGDYYTSSPAMVAIERMKSDITYINDEKMKMEILLREGAISQSTYDELEQQLLTMSIQLKEAKYAADSNYDSLKNQQDIANAQLGELKSTLNEIDLTIENTEILAPISGTIRTMYYETGDLVTGGRPFVIVDDKTGMTVSVSVTEKDLSYIKKGGKVRLSTIGSSVFLEAEVSRISPYMNSMTKMNNIEIDIGEEQVTESLIIGSSVDVEFIIEEIHNKPVISRQSLVKQLDGTYVYVIQEGVARKRQITTGLEVGDKVIVISGLENGQQIAVKNLTKLYDGAKVYIYEGVNGQ